MAKVTYEKPQKPLVNGLSLWLMVGGKVVAAVAARNEDGSVEQGVVWIDSICPVNLKLYDTLAIGTWIIICTGLS